MDDSRTRRALSLDDAVALLTRTPVVLDALVRDLPDGWHLAHEGGESWSPFDVVEHLVHGERTDWLPRVKCILEHGEATTFEPFDRLRSSRRRRAGRSPRCWPSSLPSARRT